MLLAGELEVRPAERLAVVGGRALPLSVRELELLAALVRSAGTIVPREELYETVWGAPLRRGDRSVDVYVHKLRSKLGRRAARTGASSTPTSGSATGFEPEPSHPFHKRPVTTRDKDGVTMRNNRLVLALAVCGALAFGVAACGEDEERSGAGQIVLERSTAASGARSRSTARPPSRRSPRRLRSSSTRRIPTSRSPSATSGTGGGFEKFCAGETDISDASRPIKDDEEVPVCEKDGVKYSEVQIANDGIAIATNKDLASTA